MARPRFSAAAGAQQWAAHLERPHAHGAFHLRDQLECFACHVASRPRPETNNSDSGYGRRRAAGQWTPAQHRASRRLHRRRQWTHHVRRRGGGNDAAGWQEKNACHVAKQSTLDRQSHRARNIIDLFDSRQGCGSWGGPPATGCSCSGVRRAPWGLPAKGELRFLHLSPFVIVLSCGRTMVSQLIEHERIETTVQKVISLDS